MLALFPAGSHAQAYDAPDPGGNEFGGLPVPVAGKLFGQNDDLIDFSHGQSPERWAQLIAGTGANSVKTTLEWSRAEACLNEQGQPATGDEIATCQPDNWNLRRWQVWQDVYDALRAEGITPIFIVCCAPYWAREDPAIWPPVEQQIGLLRAPPRREMDAEWGEFVKEVATRFPASVIQVWNEPNLKTWWRSSDGGFDVNPERYAEILKVAHDAVHEVELAKGVEIRVLGPGVAASQATDANHMAMSEFVNRAYAAPVPMANHIDGLSVNAFPHSDLFGEDTLFAEILEQMRAARSTAGDDTPLYITETGLSAGFGFPMSEQQRAIAAYRLYNRVMSMPDVKALVFHRMIEPEDTLPLANNPTVNKFEHGFAWMHWSPPPAPQTQAPPPVPKAVYCMFAELASRLYKPCMRVAISSAPRARTRSTTVRFEFQGIPGATFATFYECSLDGRSFKRCTSPVTYRRLKPGKHTFKVRGKNGRGAAGATVSARFTVLKRR